MPIAKLLLTSLMGLGASAFALAEADDSSSCRIDSVIGDNDLQDIERVKGTSYYDMARTVARVENLSRDGFCTGVRIGSTLMMTNYHCWQSGGCRVRFRLGFERQMSTDYQASYDCVEVVAKAADLDFAVYRVRPTRVGQMEYPVATVSGAPLRLDQELVVAGHPVLKPKQIDVSSSCKVTRAEPYVHEGVSSMQHQCDTEGGSSGSPIYDRTTGHVVALHWGAADGTGANHGVPMNLILERIGEIDPELLMELLISESD